MNMKHVDAGDSGEKEKRKRGRKPKSNPQINRYMIRLSEKDNELFLSLMPPVQEKNQRSVPRIHPEITLSNGGTVIHCVVSSCIPMRFFLNKI
ncbi:hypothetical protein EZS27_020067 [termite gut metagenome]|uniref:Uncharacterized protein n=1 Tax=termite gut metagenome TaxID=433724 RepID=A0A5J4RBH2_9ZZZZ